MWNCSQCGAKMDAGTETCGTCGASRYAIREPGEPTVNEAARDEYEPAPVPESDEESPLNRERCPACGSHRIIPDVWILDQGRGSDGMLQLGIFGDPDALIFKDRVYGVLRAWVCGRCGHTELRVRNPEEMYATYLKSKEREK